MGCEITIVKEDGYVRVHATGELDLVAARQIVVAGRKAAVEHQCGKLLIDVRDVALRLSLADLLAVADFASQVEPRLYIKAAVVSREEDLQPDRFFEKAARNRGVHLTVFTAAEAAVQWLLEK